MHGVRDRRRGRSQTNDPESSNRGSGHYQSKNPIQSSRGSGRRRVHREPMPDQVYRQDYDTTTRDSDYDHYNQEIEAPIQISEQRSRDTRSPRSQTSHLNHRHSRRESRYDEPKRDVSSRGDIDPHLRSRIRHRVKQKHLHAAPLVRWTKFMHSDTKNRKCLSADFGRILTTHRHCCGLGRIYRDHYVPLLRFCWNSSCQLRCWPGRESNAHRCG